MFNSDLLYFTSFPRLIGYLVSLYARSMHINVVSYANYANVDYANNCRVLFKYLLPLQDHL